MRGHLWTLSVVLLAVVLVSVGVSQDLSPDSRPRVGDKTYFYDVSKGRWEVESERAIRGGPDTDRSKQLLRQDHFGNTYRQDCIDYESYNRPLSTFSLSDCITFSYFAIADGLAVTGNQYGCLAIVDMSDPIQPDSLAVMNSIDASDVALRDHIAFIVGHELGFTAIDLEDPENPHVVASLDQVMGIGFVTLHESLAYVSVLNDGIYVVDIDDLENMNVLGFHPAEGNLHLDFSDDVLYVTSWQQGLLVYDVHDSTSPTLLTTLADAGAARDVQVDGTYAYLATDNSMRIVDISNPAQPLILGSYDNSGPTFCNASGICLWGGKAFVSFRYGGIKVIDISDVDDPVATSTVYVSSEAKWVEVIDGLLWTNHNSGFVTWDVENAESVPVGGYYLGNLQTRDVESYRDLLYVSALDDGVLVCRLEEGEEPEQVAALELPGWTYDVAIQDDLMVIADANFGLLIASLLVPESPRIIGELAFDDPPVFVAIKDDLVVAAVHHFGLPFRTELLMIDISDSSQPVVISTIDGLENSREMEFSGDLLYVSDVSAFNKGLHVIDLQDPWNPVHVSYRPLPGRASDVCVSGNFALVADGEAGVTVVDVLDPTVPHVVLSLDVMNAVRIKLVGNIAYVAGKHPNNTLEVPVSNISLINFADPRHPVRVGEVPLPCRAYDAVILRDHVMVGSEGGSLFWANRSCGENVVPGGTGNTRVDLALDTPTMNRYGLTASPNPFNPMVTISFELDTRRIVSGAIHDVVGRIVCRLSSSMALPPGRNDMEWRGCDDSGRAVASGTYYCRLRIDDVVTTLPITLVR